MSASSDCSLSATLQSSHDAESIEAPAAENTAADERKPWCIFTIVREEDFYLPKWVEYYGQFLPLSDLHVINHVPKSNEPGTDKCTEFLKDTGARLYVEDEEFFSSRWLRDVVVQYQTQLLKEYRAVIFTDVDEIIFINPASGFADLGDFMCNCFVPDQEVQSLRVNAYQIVHLPDAGEPEFDFSQPILSQRMYWFRDRYYDKPLLTKKPLNYVHGFHTASDMNKVVNPHVYMLHLHQFDFDWYIKRHLRWAKEFKVCDEDKRSTYNSHYRQTDVDKLEFQYYHQLFSKARIVPQLIERWVRDSLRVI